MVIVYGKIKNIDHVKKRVDRVVKCPKCNKEVKLGVELEVVSKQKILQNVYFPHIHLH